MNLTPTINKNKLKICGCQKKNVTLQTISHSDEWKRHIVCLFIPLLYRGMEDCCGTQPIRECESKRINHAPVVSGNYI